MYIHFHNIVRLCDVLPNFPSLQVKQRAIISNKGDIEELPLELRNSLRLRILGN